jgi:hypothetical protein
MKAVAAAAIEWHKVYGNIPGLSGMKDIEVANYLAQMMLIPIMAVVKNPRTAWTGKVDDGSIVHFLAHFKLRTIKDAKKVTIGLSTVIEGVGNIARTIAMIPPYEGDAENFKTMIISVMGAIIATAE